jgi:peptide/nickel transport system substrate-binding protein
MRRFAWQWLAISSVLIGAWSARAETRPQYGGTVHVALGAAPASLDPADESQADSFARRGLIRMIFDTLVTIDESGRPVAALAESWQTTGGDQKMEIHLRHGVKFHDGEPLTGEAVAAALRRGNPTWNVRPENDSVVIELEAPDPNLLDELALPRNAIAKRDFANQLSGTGPFHIVDWQPGKRLVLAAEEDYWRGRVFVDAIELVLGRSFRDEVADMEGGRADIVEIPADQMGRIPQERYRVVHSAPVQLIGLLFTHEHSSPNEKNAREALSWTVERGSMHNVLLRGAGEESASLLPAWISGYGFLIPREADLTKARQLRDQVRTVPNWSLGYDSRDPIAGLIAQRVSLNAKDAGLSVRPDPMAAPADLRLVRIPVVSTNPWIAFTSLLATLGLAQPTRTHSLEDLYAAEQTSLASDRIVPLLYLPASYASTTTLKEWIVKPDGSLDLANAWLNRVQ